MGRAGAGVLREDGLAAQNAHHGEQGFLLLGAIVAIFLVLLLLSIAAPTVARGMRREREVEAVHRGEQYTRAIQLYYNRFKHYPGSMDELEKSNNIRFLRQRYPDPMTGKPDWRLIHIGEQKTTVKGFFGQPLAGIASSGLGSASGMSSGLGGGPSTVNGGAGSAASGLGGLGQSGSGGGLGSGGLGGGGLGSSGPGTGGLGSAGVGSGGVGSGGLGSSSGGLGGSTTGSTVGGSSSSGGLSSQSASSLTGTGAPIVGIGSSATGESIVVLNEQTTHPTWEFIYDPRIEQLRAKVNLLGGGMAGGGASGLGSASGLSSPSSFGSPSTPGSPSGLGSPAGSPNGSTGTTPSTPATPPQ